MKRVIAIVLEEMLLAGYLVWVWHDSFFWKTRFDTLVKLGIVFGICIVVAKYIDVYVKKTYSTEEKDRSYASKLLFYLKRLMFISIPFLGGYIAFRIMHIVSFGVMGTMLMSVGSGFTHMLISWVLDSIVGFNVEEFMEMFADDVEY